MWRAVADGDVGVNDAAACSRRSCVFTTPSNHSSIALLRIKPGFHSNAIAKRQRQPIGMLGRSSGNHNWLLANAIKRLRFLRFSFTQRTQRKRLRLNGNRASLINRTVENKKHSIPPSFVPAFHVSANDCLHVLYWLFRLSLVKGFRFSSIGRNLAQYLKPCSEFDFNKYCTYWCKNNMYCFPVYTTDEILKIIHIFPNNKAPGPDNINSSLLINVWNYCISTRAYNIIFHLQQVVPVAY